VRLLPRLELGVASQVWDTFAFTGTSTSHRAKNPWIEAIELQESAHPYHDWNERINAECYAPNATARILDEEKRIVSIVNNYSKISFNFGPTLLSGWRRRIRRLWRDTGGRCGERPDFSGHGSRLRSPTTT